MGFAQSFLIFFAGVEGPASSSPSSSFFFLVICLNVYRDLHKKSPFFYYLEVDGPTSSLSSPSDSFPLAGLSSTCLVMRLNFGII